MRVSRLKKWLKTKVRYLVGVIRVMLNHISIEPGTNVYIGKGVNIIGGRNISLGDDVCVRPYVDLWCSSGKIELGAGVEIGERSRISIARALSIGEKVLISPNVYITDCDHAYKDINVPVMEQGIVPKDNCVIIKENSYIGINSVIVGNVTIGKNCVVGANSVVTKSIPDYCVAVGTPAKVIKEYNFETERWDTRR